MLIIVIVTAGDNHQGGKLTTHVVDIGGKWNTEAKFLVPDWGIKSTLMGLKSTVGFDLEVDIW